MTHERRSEPRYRRRLRTRYGRRGKDSERTGYSVNVGPGGLFVVARNPEPPGAKIGLEVNLPDGRVVSLVGEVAWARRVPPRLHSVAQGGFGVRIITASTDWHEFIADQTAA